MVKLSHDGLESHVIMREIGPILYDDEIINQLETLSGNSIPEHAGSGEQSSPVQNEESENPIAPIEGTLVATTRVVNSAHPAGNEQASPPLNNIELVGFVETSEEEEASDSEHIPDLGPFDEGDNLPQSASSIVHENGRTLVMNNETATTPEINIDIHAVGDDISVAHVESNVANVVVAKNNAEGDVNTIEVYTPQN